MGTEGTSAERPANERGEGRLPLAAADHRAARREHHAPDAGAAGRLEDVVCADDVAPDDGLERWGGADLDGQVHNHVDPDEGGRDRGEIGDVGLVGFHPRHGAAVEAAQFAGAVGEVTAERRADEAGQSRDEDNGVGHRASLPESSRGVGPWRISDRVLIMVFPCHPPEPLVRRLAVESFGVKCRLGPRDRADPVEKFLVSRVVRILEGLQ
jgi:hypothetical protein